MNSRCAPSVYATDASLSRVGTPELLMMISLRLFALTWRDPSGGYPDWRGGFRAARIDKCAGPAFAALFHIVGGAALRPLDVRCTHCCLLGGDEAWLLQLVSVLQAKRKAEAAAILGGWLPPAAVRTTMLPAQDLAAALARGGMILPRRHAEAAKMDHIGMAYADLSVTLVQ